MPEVRVNDILMLFYISVTDEIIRTLLRKASEYNPDEIFGLYALGYCVHIGVIS